MRRKKMYAFAVIIIALITIAFAVFATDIDEINAEFLSEYGWEIDEECIEFSDIIIPDPFDLVYENYNKMQLESGFDLRPYKGMKGKRKKNFVSKCLNSIYKLKKCVII